MTWGADAAATGDLTADYGQVELHPGAGGHAWIDRDEGLANGEFGEHVVLVVARQYGTVRLDVHVLDSAPPVDPAWDAAFELSVRAGDALTITGWAGEGSVVVPVPAGVEVRLRYVVVGGQEATDHPGDEDAPGPDRYLVQVWPSATEPPRVVASTSPWSQYWTCGPSAAALLRELADVPDPGRLVVVLDRALAAHPDVVEHLRRGDERYRTGIIRYAQELFRVTYATGAYAHVRDDDEQLGCLIDERARHAGGRA